MDGFSAIVVQIQAILGQESPDNGEMNETTLYLKFDPCGSQAEHVTSRSQKLSPILNLYE